MYFWTTIRKNRSKYNLTRGISEDDVTAILLRDVVVGRDSQKAEAALLELPGLQKYFNLLKTDREKEDFRRHMRKYINIWLPDCPFEVSTTNRYTIVTHEAATTARRSIRKGDTIKYLCGNLVAMTPQEEQDLDLTRRDFSIVMSSRKKTPSLFLGPARFANHDCNANARLVTRGSEGMQVVAVRDIDVGDEITVNYGENYFGESNCECLCNTCETEGRNGWPGQQEQSVESSGLSTPIDYSDPDAPTSRSLRKLKRRSFRSDTSPSSVGSDADNESPRKKRKPDVGKTSSSLVLDLAENSAHPRTAKAPKAGSPLRSVLTVKDIVISSDDAKTTSGHELSLKEAGQHSKATQNQDELLASIRAAFAGIDTTRKPGRRGSKLHPTARSHSDSHVPYKFKSPFSFLSSLAKPSRRSKVNFLRARTIPSPLSTRKQSLQSSPLSSVQSSSSSSEKDSIFDGNFPQNSSPATTASATAEIVTEFKSSPRVAASLSSSGLSSPPSTPSESADIVEDARSPLGVAASKPSNGLSSLCTSRSESPENATIPQSSPEASASIANKDLSRPGPAPGASVDIVQDPGLPPAVEASISRGGLSSSGSTPNASIDNVTDVRPFSTLATSRSTSGLSSPGAMPSASDSVAICFKSSQTMAASLSSSALSSAPSSLSSVVDPEEFNPDRIPQPPIKRPRGRPRKSAPNPTNATANASESKPVIRTSSEPTSRKIRDVAPTIELDIPSTRTPGDYIRTHLLLGESFSRWVDCRTCSACWVQANGYQTRKECPRCERHSKLYGYQWPKTEKWGKGDDEERVMDHRTVHRFIGPEEEAMERKRGRGVARVRDEESERAESTVTDCASDRTDSQARRGGRLMRGSLLAA